jgi:hypothetical protein
MGFPAVTPKLLNYLFTVPPDSVVTIDQIYAATGIPPRSIVSGVEHSIRTRRIDGDVIHPGREWRWMGLGENAKGVDRERQALVGLKFLAPPTAHDAEVAQRIDFVAKQLAAPTSPPRVAGKNGRVFEQLRVLKDGSLLIEDENGELYRATEIL